jgi:hypothetical protein
MDYTIFRPWGEIVWSLGLSRVTKWSFVGCLGTEERSVSTLTFLHKEELLDDHKMVHVNDSEPQDTELEQSLINKRLRVCSEAGIDVSPIQADLQAPVNSWIDTLTSVSHKSVVLDISSMPKRFFFNCIRRFIKDDNIEDLLLVYVKPRIYCAGSLSSNADPWSCISGFSTDDPKNANEAKKRLIVSVGFMTEGLRAHLRGDEDLHVDLILPFPASPWDSVHRSLVAAQEIEEGLQLSSNVGASHRITYHREAALDMSSVMSRLLRLTENGGRPATLAPLGPKPLSAAICLLACQTDLFPDYYAQPKSYRPDYSTGVDRTYAYWVKHDGNNLYSLR